MIAPNDYHNVRRWLDGCRRPLLVTHRAPDGDAIGALAAMTLALSELDLDPRAALFEPLAARYALLQEAIRWRRWDEERQTLAVECDAVVILDTCAWSQLEPIADYLPEAPRTLVIDHHPAPDPIATRPGDLRVRDQTAGALCLILAEWIKAVGVPLSPPLATALFVGLATDCGWFRYANTDARALRTAAELVEAGANPNAIHRAIYQQDPPARLRLIGRLLLSLEMHAGGRLAVMTLRRTDFEAVGADHSMTEELVNEAGRLGGTEAMVLFTEQPDGGVRVNFRSKGLLDVSALARRFDGGGHTRASGARPTGTWDEVVPGIIAATVAALGD